MCQPVARIVASAALAALALVACNGPTLVEPADVPAVDVALDFNPGGGDTADTSSPDAGNAGLDATSDQPAPGDSLIPGDVQLDAVTSETSTDVLVSIDCDIGMDACGGVCVDIQSNPLHCGRCDAQCCPGNACTAGRCVPGCSAGLSVCPGTPSPACIGGICVNLATDNANCGACGTACPAGQLCTAGVCACECSVGLVCCGPSRTCINVTNDPSHCGSCGIVCPGGPHGHAGCAAGVCFDSCDAGWTACDRACVDTSADAAHCGSCGGVCPAGDHQPAICHAGVCGLGPCDAGWSRCGSDASCLTHTDTDANNCGACGHRCPLGCAGGMCT